MNKLRHSWLDQLWIPSVLASAGAIIWIYLLPSLAVGTPLKFLLGSLGPLDVFVSFGLVAVGTLIGLVGIVLSSRRIQWAGKPDGFFAALSGEVIARRPPTASLPKEARR